MIDNELNTVGEKAAAACRRNLFPTGSRNALAGKLQRSSRIKSRADFSVAAASPVRLDYGDAAGHELFLLVLVPVIRTGSVARSDTAGHELFLLVLEPEWLAHHRHRRPGKAQ